MKREMEERGKDVCEERERDGRKRERCVWRERETKERGKDVCEERERRKKEGKMCVKRGRDERKSQSESEVCVLIKMFIAFISSSFFSFFLSLLLSLSFPSFTLLFLLAQCPYNVPLWTSSEEQMAWTVSTEFSTAMSRGPSPWFDGREKRHEKEER